MTSKGDFHTHSTYSDGRLQPAELAAMAARSGVRVMALTDHDTTAGLADMAEALQEHPEIRLVPGVELSTDVPGSEIHILGYFMDVDNAEFQRELARFRDGRIGWTAARRPGTHGARLRPDDRRGVRQIPWLQWSGLRRPRQDGAGAGDRLDPARGWEIRLRPPNLREGYGKSPAKHEESRP